MNNKVKVRNTKGVPLPIYSTEGSAGMDVFAAHDYVIELNSIDVVMTGIHVQIPEGYELQVRSRSGLALKHGVCVANGVGTIDSDFIGEIGIILANNGGKMYRGDFEIKKGDRVAQLVLAKVERVEWEQVKTLDATARGHGGFGSTGL